MIRNRLFLCSAPLKSIAALSTLALGLTACDSGTQEPAAPTPSAPEATTEETAPAHESAAAPAARGGDIDSSRFPTELPEGVTAAVPDSFPSEVPIYPGAQPAQGKGVEIDGSPQSAVQLLTNDAYTDVHRFYSDKLQSGGWTISEDSENDAAATIQASKDKYKASILITPAPGGGSDIFIVTEG
ncbi:MAG: hypothetical protein R3F35_23980 [Myxococcota bacterium]